MKTAISVEWSKQNITVYYYAIAIKCFAIAMPHAFLTLVFLKKNFDISEIAVIQAFYSIAVVLFEFPSGVLADKFNRKKIFLISNILLMVSYAIVFVSDQLLLIIIAWGLYGTAAAFETGTIDAEMIMMIKKCFTGERQKKKIEEFVGRENRISSISAIIGAILGFFLYRLIEINIYMLMGLLVFLSFLLVAFKYRSLDVKNGKEAKKLTSLVRKSIREIQNSRRLKLIIAGFGFLQMFIQLHFQLWQSFFLELGIKDTWFLLIYFLF